MGAVKSGAAAAAAGLLLSLFLPLASAAETSVPENMVKMAANGRYGLYLEKETGSVAVRVFSDDQWWYSNPIDRMEDTIAAGDSKNHLNIQLSITYFDAKGLSKTMNSYNDCIVNEGLKIIPTTDGFDAQYTLGRSKISREMVPTVFSQDRFENEILPLITDEDLLYTMNKRYKLLDASKLDTVQLNKELQKYPSLADGNLYVLSEYTAVYEIEEIYEGLSKAGYTQQDLAADNEEHGIVYESTEREVFVIPLCYRLKTDGLEVSVDCAKIEAPSSFPLVSLSVLPYMGAGSIKDEGYTFIPDGSGSLAYHNNGKSQFSMTVPIYGNDAAKSVSTKKGDFFEATMPVFGIKNNNQALFCVIEEGDALASLNVNTSGRLNSYNTVSPSFEIRPYDVVNLSSSGTSSGKVNVYQEKPYTGKICLKYYFLSGEKANYMGMAETYRTVLEKDGQIQRLQHGGYPFVLETLGAFKKQKTFLGIPYNGTVTLTTYEQTSEIIDELHRLGVDLVDVRLSGWFNGGLDNQYPSSISPVKALGGSRRLAALIQQVEGTGGRVYMDTSMQVVNEPLFSLRYNSWTHSVRYTYKETLLRFPFSISTYLPEQKYGSQFLLSPVKISETLDKFTRSLRGIGGSAFYNDMGNLLYSDFHTSKLTNRQAALELVQTALNSTPVGYGVKSGNVYALKGAALITDMAAESNRYFLADESVPFTQIVLHGYTNYTTQAINMADDYKTAMLKAVETGSLLYYTWNYENSHELMNTKYQQYYSTQYKNWIEEAAAFYRRIKTFMTPLQTQRITQHQKLQDNVYLTGFEKGAKVIVNYSLQDITYEGQTIPKQDFLIMDRAV